MLNKIYQEYIGSLKKIDVEEIPDILFFRPLAFLLVKLVYKTGVTPNQLTFIAILFALAGGYIFAQGGKENFFIGGIFFAMYNIFDCADGQLARLKKNGSSLGRIIDGFADYIAGIALYLAIGFGFANNSPDSQTMWIFTLIAAGSNILHAIAVDYYRNRYLDYALDRDGTLQEDLQHHYEEYEKISKQKGFYFQKFLYKIYFGYSKIQLLFASKSSDKKVRKYDRDFFLRYNKLAMRAWTFIGPTSELTFFIYAAMTNNIEIYIISMAIIVNLIAAIILSIQVFVNYLMFVETA